MLCFSKFFHSPLGLAFISRKMCTTFPLAQAAIFFDGVGKSEDGDEAVLFTLAFGPADDAKDGVADEKRRHGL